MWQVDEIYCDVNHRDCSHSLNPRSISSVSNPEPTTEESSVRKPTDQDLVAAINQGNEDAFATLYERYKDWVVSLSFRFNPNHDDSLDVLQETFAYLVRKFPGFELTAQMTTFLYPAVRNLSIAARKKRQRSTSSDENLDLFPQAESEDTSTRDDFAQMLTTLSHSHREILLMRFVDDMTQPEIATALSLPLGTVKSRLHHAVQAVKNSPAIASMLNSD